jgi:hypothetical protein
MLIKHYYLLDFLMELIYMLKKLQMINQNGRNNFKMKNINAKLNLTIPNKEFKKSIRYFWIQEKH